MEVGCGGGGGYRDTLPLLFPPLRTQVQMEADALRFGRFPEGFIINFAETEKSYHRMVFHATRSSFVHEPFNTHVVTAVSRHLDVILL